MSVICLYPCYTYILHLCYLCISSHCSSCPLLPRGCHIQACLHRMWVRLEFLWNFPLEMPGWYLPAASTSFGRPSGSGVRQTVTCSVSLPPFSLSPCVFPPSVFFCVYHNLAWGPPIILLLCRGSPSSSIFLSELPMLSLGCAPVSV